MATYTYDEKTNREDLTDVIVNLSPTDTPITSMIGKTKAQGTYHEFPTDELAEAGDNAQIEGADYTGAEVAGREREGNYTQIMSKTFKVTGTQQVVDKAGVSDEYAYQQLKKMKEIGKDLEYAITKNLAAAAGDKKTARKMAGLPGLIKTNVLDNKGTARAITGALISDALQKAWEKGGTPNKLVCSGSIKRAISAMTTSNTKNVNAKEKTLTEAVDVFDTDFGRVEMVASRFMGDDSVYILDPELIKVAWLRPFQKMDLPKTGDSKAGMILGEMTLEVKGEKGNAIIKDLKA